MWLILKVPQSRDRLHLPGGLAADPQDVIVGGSRVVGYHVPDHEPSAPVLRKVPWPTMAVVEDEDVSAPPAEVPAAAPSQSRANEELALRQALYLDAQRLGWTAHDLDGTWDGTDWSEPDARGTYTGLTLLEMRQTRPPKDWAALAAEGRAPWESPDWVDPVPGWVPPAWTSPIPRPNEEAAAADMATETFDGPAADDTPTDVFDTLDTTGAVDPDAPTVMLADPVLLDGVLGSAEGADDADPVSVEPEGDVWGYPEEQIPRARRVVTDEIAKYPEGSNVPRARINAALRKAGLKTLTDDRQVQWFLNLPDTET